MVFSGCQALHQGVRLLTRNGIDWSSRFPLIVRAVGALKARSCLIDGEAIAFEDDGLASFELLLGRRRDRQVALCAFDLLELDGRDLRRTPFEERKCALARLVGKPRPGIMLMPPSRSQATWCSSTHVRSAGRASCRSASARATAQCIVWPIPLWPGGHLKATSSSGTNSP